MCAIYDPDLNKTLLCLTPDGLLLQTYDVYRVFIKRHPISACYFSVGEVGGWEGVVLHENLIAVVERGVIAEVVYSR